MIWLLLALFCAQATRCESHTDAGMKCVNIDLVDYEHFSYSYSIHYCEVPR